MITTTTHTLAAEPARTRHRISRPGDALRLMIVGVVLLVVSVGSLFGAVTDWSQLNPSGLVGNHYVQVILAAVGCALVIGGIVKNRKQH